AITIGCLPAATGCRLAVSDQGAGMSPEQVQHVLSGDFIVSSTYADERKGNGLGYLIVREAVALLDAQLQIESAPGQGTTVFVNLPGKN
ncbi:MAG: ATP-binding protein, partial [Sphingobacteriales bacterium]